MNSLRTTLCIRFKSGVVACGVVYATAQRFQVPLPENPPWWKAFDVDKSGIDEFDVCYTAKGSSSAANQESGKNVLVKAALAKLNELKKSNDDSKSMPTGGESREDPESKIMSDHRTEAGGGKGRSQG
ncbi:cyclin-L1-1-like [Forsythia ovata]|uniref:Cyclin-L1-1-like n=1 Tax=Forsythia ovata TaxID=205694 RepID=A0ABD1U6U8_9LAMI